MKRMTISLLVLALASAPFAADVNNLLNFSFGGSWPDTDFIKSNDKKVVLNGSAEWGKVFDKRITIGAKIDLSWHLTRYTGSWAVVGTDTVFTAGTNIYQKDRVFMVPFSAWIGIDPIPQYRFHPVIHAQFGYNSLFKKKALYADFKPADTEEFKYYNGVFSKFGIDGMFDLGSSASVFAGFEYQVAPLYHNDDGRLESISFNAPIVRIGISFLY